MSFMDDLVNGRNKTIGNIIPGIGQGVGYISAVTQQVGTNVATGKTLTTNITPPPPPQQHHASPSTGVGNPNLGSADAQTTGTVIQTNKGSNIGPANSQFPTDTNPVLNFITEGTSYTSGLTNNPLLLSFHDTVRNYLQNNAYGLDISNMNEILSTAPSEWRDLFSSNPEQMNMFYQNLRNLGNVADQLWNGSGFSASPAAQVYRSYQMNKQANEAYKGSMNDHPDSSSYQTKHNDTDPTKPTNASTAQTDSTSNTSSFDSSMKYLGSASEYIGEGIGVASQATAIGGTATEIAAGLGIGVDAALALGTAAEFGVFGLAAGALFLGSYEIYKAFGGEGDLPIVDEIMSWF